jgi:hypothetical protein
MRSLMLQQNPSAAECPNELADGRRSEPRVVCERDLWIFFNVSDSAEMVKVHLSDASQHGLGLVLPQAIPAGQQVMAKVNVSGKPTMLVYTICYCIPTQSDQFRAGARFSGYAATRFRGEGQALLDGLTGA